MGIAAKYVEAENGPMEKRHNQRPTRRKPVAALPQAAAPRVRRVGVVVYPEVHILDMAGPQAVFEAASRLLKQQGVMTERAYEVMLLGPSTDPVPSTAGVTFLVDRSYLDFDEKLDTLLIAGGQGSRTLRHDKALLDWLLRMAPQVRRLGSVCTGALVLAATGLLDGKRATTHWGACALLAHDHPAIEIDADAIWVRDGNLYSSAGVTAGMDLALALVEEDWGRSLALEVARLLVMFVKRPGGQSQYSAHLAAQVAESPPIRALQGWILDHLTDDLSVPALASQAAMSPRNFARIFTREAGSTPGDFVETARLEAARRLLEESAHSVEIVALRTGFGNAERLRRACQRRLGVSPQDYRQHFRSRPAPHPHAAVGARI
jgi:transcriptional regulator GlxA family with amidase domain